MLNIIAAILVFGFIVLIHELGHFLFAKLNGITVLEFSIGMGPRLFSFVKGETRYSLKILPFGGSCMMAGEDGGDSDPRAFNNKSVWARISVIAAGPVFNILLAFVSAIILVAYVGVDRPVLSGVMEGYPAEEAGLQAGDRIIKINDRKVTAQRDVSWYMMVHPEETYKIHVQRPSGESYETKTVTLTPRFAQEYQSYMLGVEFSPAQKASSLFELIRAGAYEVKFCMVSTFDSIGMLIGKKIAVDEAVAGPVQIVSMVGETVGTGREAGGAALLIILSNWILLLSTSLGIMNLLPIPALDGGRLVFLLIELLRGKPVDPEKEGMVHMAGMMVLMALMVFILFNDIRNLM